MTSDKTRPEGERGLVSADEMPVQERYEGVRYVTVDDFFRGHHPGWVKLAENTPAYRIGARYYVRCMSGAVIGRLGEEHTITEHDDGAITVEPSLIMHNGWHGFLRHGWFQVLEWGTVPDTGPTA